jgi:hypothetical protein
MKNVMILSGRGMGRVVTTKRFATRGKRRAFSALKLGYVADLTPGILIKFSRIVMVPSICIVGSISGSRPTSFTNQRDRFPRHE